MIRTEYQTRSKLSFCRQMKTLIPLHKATMDVPTYSCSYLIHNLILKVLMKYNLNFIGCLHEVSSGNSVENVETSSEAKNVIDNEVKETFVCPICGKNFQTPLYTKSHMLRTHMISTEVQNTIPNFSVIRRDITSLL